MELDHSPDWAPLEALRPNVVMDDWMWMSRVDINGTVVEQYKHYYTRRYLNLDQAGHAYRLAWNGSGVLINAEQIPVDEAIRQALA